MRTLNLVYLLAWDVSSQTRGLVRHLTTRTDRLKRQRYIQKFLDIAKEP